MADDPTPEFFDPAMEPPPELEMPTSVGFFEPCEIYLSRAQLLTEVRRNLASLETRMTEPGMIRDAQEEALLKRAVFQRQEFIKWLEAHPREHVYTAVYPVSEYEPHEDV